MAGLTSDEIAKTVQPSNLRNWVPSLAVMPTAELAGQALTVRNIRYCNYLSEQDYIVRYYDKTFDLNRLQSVDFLVVPFKDATVWLARCSVSGSASRDIWWCR